jgi:hypothetical protein
MHYKPQLLVIWTMVIFIHGCCFIHVMNFHYFGQIFEFNLGDTLDHSSLTRFKHEQLIDIIMFICGNQFHPNQIIFPLCW